MSDINNSMTIFKIKTKWVIPENIHTLPRVA